MKRKYHGVVAAISAVVTLVAVGAYAGSGLWRTTEGGRQSFWPTALNIKVPSEVQVRQMEALDARMDQLALPTARSVAAKTLALFGYQDPSTSRRGADDREPDHTGSDDWKLTLTVRAGVNSYCVINGNFVAEGDTVEEGTRVLKIENHRVLLLARQVQRWLYLEDELSSSVNDTQQATPIKGKGHS